MAEPSKMIVPGTTNLTGKTPRLVIDRTTFRLPDDQIHREQTDKDMIVLHNAGAISARYAYNTWLTDSKKVGPAYLVDRDGGVYELFDPQYWAEAIGGTDRKVPFLDRRSIQIEMVNWGPLKQSGNILSNWTLDWGGFFCTTDQTDRYLAAEYRDIRFWERYPAEQIVSLCQLVKYLCETFKIPKVLPESRIGECDLAFFNTFKGIVDNSNLNDSCYDVGPAFPWQDIRDHLRG